MESLITIVCFAFIGALAYNAFKPECKGRFTEAQLRRRARMGYSVDYAPNNF